MAKLEGQILGNNNSLIATYSEITREELLQKIGNLMVSRGYKLQSDGTFQKGSFALRLLLGGFYSYYKFRLMMNENESGSINITLTSTSSGASGGILGVKRMNAEVATLKGAFALI